jgi:hypothetical protein
MSLPLQEGNSLFYSLSYSIKTVAAKIGLILTDVFTPIIYTHTNDIYYPFLAGIIIGFIGFLCALITNEIDSHS